MGCACYECTSGSSSQYQHLADHVNADALGLPDVSLSQIMADFYLLDMLAAKGSKVAARKHSELAERIAPIFYRYCGIIVGGEVRYAATGQGLEREYWCACECGRECDCAHEDGWGMCGCYSEYGGSDSHELRNCYCECDIFTNSCDTDHDEDEECDCTCNNCGDAVDDCECRCAQCDGDCGCTFCDNCEVIYEGVDYYSLGPGGVDMLEDLSTHDREDAWSLWINRILPTHGNKAYGMAARAFESLPWQEGYGGESWATIARLAYDYGRGKLKAITFVDRCWSLEHNNGNMFNKVWSYHQTCTLSDLLVKQYENKYDALTPHASPDVVLLWKRGKETVVAPNNWNRQQVLRELYTYDPAWLGREVDNEIIEAVAW